MAIEPGPRELVLGTLAVGGLALLAHALVSAASGQICTVGGSCLTAAAEPAVFWTTIGWLVASTSLAVGGAWLGSRRLGMPLLPARQRELVATATPAPPRLRLVKRQSTGG